MDEYFGVKGEKPKAEKPMKKEPKAKKEKKPKTVKLKTIEKPKRQKARPTVRKLKKEVFEDVKSKYKKEFESLPASEQLAIIELEKLKKQIKAQKEEITKVPEELKSIPKMIGVEEELAILRDRLERAERLGIKPAEADVKRVEKILAIEPAKEPLLAIEPMKAEDIPKNIGELKATEFFKQLKPAEKIALLKEVGQGKMTAKQRSEYLKDLYSQPFAKRFRSIQALVSPAEDVTASFRPGVGGKSASVILPSIKRVLPSPPVPTSIPAAAAAESSAESTPTESESESGSGLGMSKISKPKAQRLLKKVQKAYPHPVDTGIIIGIAKHPKMMSGSGLEQSIDTVLKRFKEGMVPQKFHMQGGIHDLIRNVLKIKA